MKFDYDSFISSLHKEFEDTFSKIEVKELLNLEAEIHKDTPLSTGKRLEVNYLAFSGKKTTEEEQDFTDDIIDYHQEIHSGVNMWIADNLKGKSSIFKIIKFALTGDNSLKPNISKWVDHILVVFSINDKKYTVYINNSKKSIQASLYNKVIRTYPKEDEYQEEQLFLSTSKDGFVDEMRDFFFRQFDYYSLRWTQKSSAKDKDDLLEAGASWLTYFKSIFLESKDTAELMYGAQGTKVFQMLLGLYLTSPINKLTIEKDKLMHLKGKQQTLAIREVSENEDKKSELQNDLDEVNIKLQEIILVEKETVDTSQMVKDYEDLVKAIADENAKILLLNSELQENRKLKSKTEGRRQLVEDELNKLQKELHKAERQHTDIKEYLEIGVFFSNLELKTCPSCSHPVSKEKKELAVNAHTCALCSDDVSKDIADVNTDSLSVKLDELSRLQEGIKLSIGELRNELEELKKKSNDLYNANIKLELQQNALSHTEKMGARLLQLQENINEERKKIRPRDAEKNELIQKKAILNFRIEQLDQKPEKTGDQKIEKKIHLLGRAIEELNKIRFAEGQSILKKLSDLMIIEVQALGLRISEITINDRFDIRYKQDGDYLSFSEIAEGEQLRAKLAFYLSLIQLDIEHNYGRHSRFLIIDSPGKEEGDKNYLEGLTKLITELENRFGNKLQILIGTAERSLENTVKHQNIFPAETFVF